MVGSGTGGWEGKRPHQENAAIEKLPKRNLQGAAQKARSIATIVGSAPDPAINSAVLAAPACEQMKGRDCPKSKLTPLFYLFNMFLIAPRGSSTPVDNQMQNIKPYSKQAISFSIFDSSS